MSDKSILPSGGAANGDNIRMAWHANEWYFSIIDVISVATDRNYKSAQNYWHQLKHNLALIDAQPLTHTKKLKMPAADGKMRFTDAGNRELILRIIQEIPGPKTNEIKDWLAVTGAERLEENDDPELMLERFRKGFRRQGRTEEWIELRIQSIIVRQELTDEWKERNVKEGREFAVLTSVISKGTFGITPSEHGKIKGLKRQNLRDHMSNLELVFTSLGEVVTTDLTRDSDAEGFHGCSVSAQEGGKIAGEARKVVEAGTGKKVVSSENFLAAPQDKPKRLKKKND